ncbi:uncharacterized protein LOC110860958 [Folsomia candida]|uniref:uncharacterized protein LOC110860958 n=1 Tax=Folsomia candida TaxID=158441 RepID=UPI000B8F428E|nr:uncharacterized protein LOC110860958 [Folsomia candida]XP_021965771.1 uncharacterized protein LOC110860958 [Folsomia candida]
MEVSHLLPEETILEMTENTPNSIKETLYEGLQAWKERQGSMATVEQLVKILESLNFHDAAESIRERTAELGPQDPTSIPGSSRSVSTSTTTETNLEEDYPLSNMGYSRIIDVKRARTWSKQTIVIGVLVIIVLSAFPAWYYGIIPIRMQDKYPANQNEVVTSTENNTTSPLLRENESLDLQITRCRRIHGTS